LDSAHTGRFRGDIGAAMDCLIWNSSMPTPVVLFEPCIVAAIWETTQPIAPRPKTARLSRFSRKRSLLAANFHEPGERG
jgi:hypothetical protein